METRRIIKEIPDFPYNQVRRIAKGTDNIYWIALGVARTAITVVVTIPAIPTPVRISGLCFTGRVFSSKGSCHRTFYHQCTRFKSYRTLYMDGDSCSRSISLSHTDS